LTLIDKLISSAWTQKERHWNTWTIKSHLRKCVLHCVHVRTMSCVS